MWLFLFLKQFVDMFYQYQILDYGMVVLAVALLGYRIVTEQIYHDIKAFWNRTDWIVLLLAVAYAISWLRYPSAYGTFFKVESVFLLYFLGRAYGEKVLDYGRWLVIASYVVIYVNAIYRFYLFGYRLWLQPGEEGLLNLGGLYYYKTDLAVAMVIAVLFIYMFSRQYVLKWITIVPIAGYMVFYSGARIMKVILALEYVIIIYCEYKKRKKKEEKRKNGKLLKTVILFIGVIGVIFLIAIQFLPYEEIWTTLDSNQQVMQRLENLLHSRHIIWLGILEYFANQTLATRLFGIDLTTDSLHNFAGLSSHSIYIKTIYSVGYVGCLFWYFFFCNIAEAMQKSKERDLVCVTGILWVMLFTAGLSAESLESTQMSWFPMLFAGVLVTSAGGRKEV